MSRTIARVLATLLLVGGLAARVAGGDAPAPPTRWVTDASGFISEGARQDLDGQLEAYQRQTGHQLLVWIDRTTGGIPLEDFTVRAFAAWKVGRKGLDDGLVLFVFSQDQKVRIEVGYGLEGQVPDAIASRIIRQTIVPRIQADDHDGAIREGVAALRAAIEGQAPPAESAPGPAPSAGAASSLTFGQMILLGLAIIGFLVLFATNPALATYLLFTLLSGGRGGRGGGGGGYSGGGGRGGGGGASGSW